MISKRYYKFLHIFYFTYSPAFGYFVDSDRLKYIYVIISRIIYKIFKSKKYNFEMENDFSERITSNYSSLIKRVGDAGRYQWIVFTLIFLTCIYSSFFGASINFLFLNPGFDCSTLGVSEIECEHYVCENINLQDQHLYEKQQELNSLVTEFGPFHCEQNYGISLLRSLIFAGTGFGFIAFTWYAVNKSRKNAIVLGLIACIVGSLIMLLADSLFVASLGIFIIGIGFFTNVRFGISLVSEITQHVLSQKFTSFLVIAFSIGSFLSGIIFGEVSNWRTVILYFSFIYNCVLMLLFWFFVEDTPKMLLRLKSVEKVSFVLKKIAKINKVEYTIEEQEIIEYMKQEKKYEEVQKNINLFDIFRFPSIRLTAILFFSITVALDFLFFSHYAISNIFGIGSLRNIQLMGVFDILGVVFVECFIKNLPRTKASILIYTTLAGVSLVTILIKVPSNCQICSEAIFQLILVLLVRMLMNFQFAVFLVHQTEFYPVSVRVIGLGIGGFCGAIAQGICQIVMIDSEEWGISPFFIIMIFQLLTVILYLPIPETLGIQPRDQVIQMIEKKNFIDEDKQID